MEWTEKDRQYLLDFRKNLDYDGIKVKQQIKKALLDNKYIIHVLNNKELEDEDAEPDDYYGINILPVYMITPTQHNVQNYLCFTVSYDDVQRYNSAVKYLEVTFTILCEAKNITDRDTSLPRHDLLAALVQDQFNYTNLCGRKIMLVEDKEIVVDTSYAGRQLLFQQITDNNLIKTKNGTASYANKGINR